MKKFSLLLMLLASLPLAGCARYYQITLQNGNRITTRGKPKYVRGYYVFRDVNGQTNAVSETRVHIIEPRPRGESEESAFNPSRH